MVHAVEFLLDADYLLHYLDALVVFAALGQDVALCVELVQLLAQH